MPNWINVRIKYEASETTAYQIFQQIRIDHKFNFNTLIPTPVNIYLGPTGVRDSEDFGKHTWYRWAVDNWGTKWNACECSDLIYESGIASFRFSAAWHVPYPIIIAFGNKFKVPFTLEYCEECGDMWGVEMWRVEAGCNHIERTSTSKNCIKDKKRLCTELSGLSPEEIT